MDGEGRYGIVRKCERGGGREGGEGEGGDGREREGGEG